MRIETFCTRLRRSLLGLCLCCLGPVASAEAAAPPPSSATCPPAASLDLTAAISVERDPQAPLDRYEVSFTGPGVFAVRLSTTDVSQPAAVLALTSGACAPPPQAVVETVHQSAQDLILRVKEGGSLRLEVAPEDPASALERYGVRTAFAGDPVSTGPKVEPPQDPPASCGGTVPQFFDFTDASQSAASNLGGTIDPWDCDVVSGELAGGGVLILEGWGTDLEAALYEGASCGSLIAQGSLGGEGTLAAAVGAGETRLVLDAATGASGTYTVAAVYFPLCAPGAQDDHGDFPLCATEVAYPSVTTGFGGGAGDEDIVTFRLAQQQSVEITLTAAHHLHCQLLDAAGPRLSEWEECGGGGSQVLHRNLAAGRYRVVVTGSGAPGSPFSLALGSVAVP